MERKVLLAGLDSAAPDLVFRRFGDKLPNFRRMMKKGVYGRLESCDPPITIPAWMVMATGKNPGRLGIYGFRNRRGYSYKDIWIASSMSVRERKLWDILAVRGIKSCLVAVPPSYPPTPINGWLVSGFLTPDTDREYTYPKDLKREIEALVEDYIPDVEFRVEDKKGLIQQVYEMTEKRFEVIKHLVEAKDWGFFMFMEIGLDRVQHAFWKYFDEEHHLHVPGNEFQSVVEDYYVYLDRKMGELLSLLGEDTVVLVASDHGAKRMKGAFCFNSWLIREGLLKLGRPIKEVTRLEDADVDWGRTVAWGWGGYYARVFLNVKGREERGIIDPAKYEKVREELVERIGEIKGPRGEVWRTRVLKPEEVFPECRGNPPDLMVYFDDLYWRSAGTLGQSHLYLPENDTGPDDAVHDKYGLFIYYDPKRDLGGVERELKITDIAPTVLKSMGMPIPRDMEGRPLSGSLIA